MLLPTHIHIEIISSRNEVNVKFFVLNKSKNKNIIAICFFRIVLNIK